MRVFRTIVPALVLLLALVAGSMSAAQASDALDRYRASGVIAERYDGFVELRDTGAPADAARLVSTVNSERRAIYEKRASEQNVPVSAVGTLFAKKIVETAPSGTYFKLSDGSYRRK